MYGRMVRIFAIATFVGQSLLSQPGGPNAVPTSLPEDFPGALSRVVEFAMDQFKAIRGAPMLGARGNSQIVAPKHVTLEMF